MTHDHERATAATFDAWARRGWGAEMADEHVRTAGVVLHELGPSPGQRWLDLGCGTGWATHRVAAAGAEAVGLDLSRAMLAEAVRGAVPGDPTTFVCGHLGALPFADQRFDVVFSMETLYYARELDVALAEAFRVCALGGTVAVLVDVYPATVELGLAVEDPVPVHVLGVGGWEDRLREAGLVDVRARQVREIKPVDADPEDPGAWRWREGTLVVTGRRP